MSRHRIVHAVAACALALVMIFAVTACARAPLRGDTSMNASENYEMDMNAVDVDVGSENAMAAPERPDFETAPPPPPAPESGGPDIVLTGTHVARPASAARPGLRPPATDTAAEGPAPEADNRPFAGLGAFVRPPVWKVGNAYSLEFVVGQNEAGLQSVSEGRERTTARSIWMAPTMRVTLDPNPNFEIAPQNREQEIQDLSPDRTAAWFWNVKPLKPGKFTLVARVEALQRGADGELLKGPDGKLRSRMYPPKTVDVQVRVSGKERVRGAIDTGTWLGEALGKMFKSWEGMLLALAALITAAGGVWAAIRKLQGKPIRPRRLRRKKAA